MSSEAAVPDEVEALLVDVARTAGALGGSIGGSLGGGFGRAGAAGGASGGESAARRMKTKSATEVVPFDGELSDVVGRCRRHLPRLVEVPGPPDRVRFVAPVGRTGLQQIVVDVIVGVLGAAGEATVTVRAYGKEGLISRKPTARTAAEVAAALNHTA